jgi:hypothetical protein
MSLKSGDSVEVKLDALDFRAAFAEAHKNTKMLFLEQVALSGFKLKLETVETDYVYRLDSVFYKFSFKIEVY